MSNNAVTITNSATRVKRTNSTYVTIENDDHVAKLTTQTTPEEKETAKTSISWLAGFSWSSSLVIFSWF